MKAKRFKNPKKPTNTADQKHNVENLCICIPHVWMDEVKKSGANWCPFDN